MNLPIDSLRQRTALVTGGGKNLGRAIAQRLAQAGARVVVSGRRPDALAATVASIVAAGGDALAVPADVTDARAVEQLVAAAAAAFGPVDVLAAVAGGGGAEQALDAVEPAAWANVIAVNLVGTFHCVRAVLPGMRARGRGSIVSCVGGGAFFPQLGATISAYATAKAGLCRFTDQLAVELFGSGIRINALEPGQVVTREHWAALPATARPGLHPPEHAAELATFLLGDESAPLTGRTVTVDEDWWRDRERLLAVAASQHAACLRRVVP